MSDNAVLLAELVERLAADLPFAAQPVEEALGAELEKLERSNAFFTLYEGACDGAHGVRLVEVREPTLASIADGKRGLVVLTPVDGVDLDSVCAAFAGLQRLEVAPTPGDPLDLMEFRADREWGRITVAVDRSTQCVRSVLLDTSP